MSGQDDLLLHGDNLPLLARHVADGSVDLVYADPPFNSDARYGLLRDVAQPAGTRVFEDTWRWSEDAERAFDDLAGGPGAPCVALAGLRTILGPSSMLAYLVMMAPRLLELRRVLRPTGSIYLHCDGSACHYLKVLMDAVFGAENFLNHIVWLYGLGGSSPRYWPRKHDDILWYSRERGRHYFEPVTVPATSRRMAGQAKKAPDYWDIPALNNMARERLGYPTQKPEALLERIIISSSRAGEVVLDPFCGSGTTAAVAARLGRRWIAIDVAETAIEITTRRLRENALTTSGSVRSR